MRIGLALATLLVALLGVLPAQAQSAPPALHGAASLAAPGAVADLLLALNLPRLGEAAANADRSPMLPAQSGGKPIPAKCSDSGDCCCVQPGPIYLCMSKNICKNCVAKIPAGTPPMRNHCKADD